MVKIKNKMVGLCLKQSHLEGLPNEEEDSKPKLEGLSLDLPSHSSSSSIEFNLFISAERIHTPKLINF
jgi:hypothetical protein